MGHRARLAVVWGMRSLGSLVRREGSDRSGGLRAHVNIRLPCLGTLIDGMFLLVRKDLADIRQAPYPGKASPKQVSRYGYLRHLKSHAPCTPHGLGSDLNQLVTGRGKRPMLHARR